MAATARWQCLYLDRGYTWHKDRGCTRHVMLHSSKCLLNPAATEARTYRQQAETRREATEAEERREQRDYLRQQEAARAGAANVHPQEAPPHDLLARPMDPKPGTTITSTEKKLAIMTASDEAIKLNMEKQGMTGMNGKASRPFGKAKGNVKGMKVGHLKAQCRSLAANNAKDSSEAESLDTVEQLTITSKPMPTKRGDRAIA